MNGNTFLQIIYAIRDDKFGDIFSLIRQGFDDETALKAITYLVGDDKRVYGILLNALGTHELCETLLETQWAWDRIIEARPNSVEFFFFVSLKNGGDDPFQIGCSVAMDKGISTVWFHHTVTNARMLDPQLCVEWNSLSKEDEAMWTLLANKIYGLSNEWFIEAAKAANDALLVPYDLDN
ncbi:hypothetical protein LJR153_007136 [Paenibacillus sp. LjRoot153]|uniref:hypothetical protein n=1 Tax=Paenibacillus sp. LjRoot153 TaxID=3342270 RepID=UPI003ED077DD